jgi:thiol-disulfide isomerase/thioredoxin
MKVNKVGVFGLIFILSIGGISVSAQRKVEKQKHTGYEITFVLQGLQDTVLYLANYYADKTYMYDTLFPLPKSPYTFVSKKDSLLPRGIYLLANQDKVKLMELVIDSSFSFTVEAKNLNPTIIDIPSNVRFINSPENETANAFFITMSYYQRQIMTLSNNIKAEESSETPDRASIEQQKDSRRNYQDSMRTYMWNFVENNRHTLFGKAQLLLRDVDIPEPQRNPDGSLVDSNFAYHYYISHYWDNTDFLEPALISTPVFYTKLKNYFDDVVPPLLDSITKYADLLIEKTKDTPELFRYIVWYITNKYERSQYVAHDAVFVHMVENYYGKGLCPWTDEAVLERMVNQEKKLKSILIGKKAPELYMADPNGVFRSNYEPKQKYTIMWFWDISCGHCKTITPKLVEFYNRAKDSLDFEVYAVCITMDTAKWKQTIIEREMPWINVGGNQANLDYRQVYDVTTTPVIFVLDHEKKIIVKKIGAEELEPFLRNYDEGKIRY